MSGHIEEIHLEERNQGYNMPYTPALKVRHGSLVFVSGVTAAPMYHSHPHVPEEFDAVPEDPGTQAKMAVENLRRVLKAAGGDLRDVVQLFRFVANLEEAQDAINLGMAREMGGHRPTTTTVEVVRLATDPRLVVELAAVAAIPDAD